MNRHVLPDLDERAGLGARLVRRAVVLTLGGVALLAATLFGVLLALQIEITVKASGTLEPLHVWRVHSFAAGVIREVHAVPGRRVERGEILARLDPFALEAELRSLRLEAKHKRHGREARAEIARFDDAIETIEARLERLTIRAPDNGVMLSEEVDRLIGQHVQEGQLLFEIGSVGTWKAVLAAPEREIDPIRLGDLVKLAIPAVSDVGSWLPESLPATVTFIGSEPLDQSTPSRGLYRIYAQLDTASIDPGRCARLRRGMTTEARVVTRSARAIDLLLRHFKRRAGVDG